MQDLIIFGAGGFSKDVHFLIDCINAERPTYKLVGFLDDNTEQPSLINGVPYLGTRSYLEGISSPVALVLALSHKEAVRSLVDQSRGNGHILFPNIIHPSCIIDHAFLNIGRGNIFNAGCLLSRNIHVGDFNIFNNHVSVGHDVSIGSFNLFGPRTQISGGVHIGNNNFFGLNASVLQYKQIGNNNMIGACTFVAKNLKDDRKVFGIPAKNMIV